MKSHTLLALQGNFPTLVIITSGKVHDENILDDLVFEQSAFYVMDRGHVYFGRLHRVSTFFVTRAKASFQFRQRYSAPVDKIAGVRFDQTVVLTGAYSHQQYPDVLRRIGYTNPDTGKTLIFLTNNLTEPAITIAQLCRCR